MNKKYICISLTLAIVMSFSACGSKQEGRVNSAAQNVSSQTGSQIISQTGSQKTSSLSSEAVKELESVPGLSSDSVAAAEDETISAAESEAESSELADDTVTDTDTDTHQAVEVGGLTLSATEIPFDEKVKISNADKSDAAYYGDTLYLLDGKKLTEFEVSEKAAEKNVTKLSGSYSRVDTDPYGTVYLSRERFESAILNENGDLTPLDATGEISLSKNMEYGLCRSQGKITKFTDESGEWSSVAEKELEFPNNVSAVEFSGDHVLIAHSMDGAGEVTVCSYDGDVIASTEGGSAGEEFTTVAEGYGVIAASSNGDLCLWNTDGELIGRLGNDDTANLLGADSPVTIKRLFNSGDGEMLAFCEDADGNSGEARLFRIMGF